MLYISICGILNLNLFSCTDQINTKLSRDRLGQVALGLENGGHKAEVSVSAVQTCACSLTLLQGSTICQTHTGELERLGRGSAMVPVDLRLKSTLTHQPTHPSGEETYFNSIQLFLLLAILLVVVIISLRKAFITLCSHQQCSILQQPCHRFSAYLLAGPTSYSWPTRKRQ